MHAAPPARVVVGRHGAWSALAGAVVAAATGNVVAWCLLLMQVEPALALALWAALLAGGLTVWRTRRSQGAGELLWDGAQWQWKGVAGRAEVAIDLGGWLLLRFESDAGPLRWIAVSRSAAVGPWAALRAALHSPRPADPLDAPTA